MVGFPGRKFVFLWESKKSPRQGAGEGVITMHLLGWVLLLKLCCFLCFCFCFFSYSSTHGFLFLQCDGCERSGVITLIPGYGNPLSHYHCREVGLMLFDCDGLIPVNYAFNGGWLAVTVYNFIIFIVFNLSSSH